MGRRRKHGKGLPERVYPRHGALYYETPGTREWVRLGTTTAEAFAKLATLVPSAQGRPIHTVGDLVDRYALEVLPGKAPRTQREQTRQLATIRKAFRTGPVRAVTQEHVVDFKNARRFVGAATANRELSLLRDVFRYAIEWKARRDNPCDGVMRVKERPQRDYVDDARFYYAYRRAKPMIRVAMALAYLTGLRQEDNLRLSFSEHVQRDAIRLRTRKTGKGLAIACTPVLRRVLARSLRLSPPGDHVIRTTRARGNLAAGRGYTSGGFQSEWKRLMASLPAERRFKFKDIRAKNASDDESLQDASARLGHTSTSITARVYRQGMSRVRPLR